MNDKNHAAERPHMEAAVVSSEFEGACDFCKRGNTHTKDRPYTITSSRPLLTIDSLSGSNIRIRIRMCRQCLDELRTLLMQTFTGLEED